MRIVARNLILTLACVLALSAVVHAAPEQFPAPSPTPRLLAYGNPQRFWVAQVLVDPQDPSLVQTTIHVREAGDGTWIGIARIPARVTAMASRGSDVAVVLDNGDWMLLWQGGSVAGASLPGHGSRLICLATGPQDRLWGVGKVPGGIAALPPRLTTTRATLPATAPQDQLTSPPAASAVATSGPSSVPAASTQPLPMRLVLFTYEPDGTWQPQSNLPLIGADPDRIALIGQADQAIVAQAAPSGPVHIQRFSPAGGWSPEELLTATQSQSADFDLIADGTGRLMLWQATPSAGGTLISLGPPPGNPIPLALSPTFSNSGTDRAIALAVNRIRLLLLKDSRLYEQTYDFQGAAQGQPTEILASQMPNDVRVNYWLNMAVFVMLILVLLGTMRRRDAASRSSDEPLDQLQLAPLGTRLLAGLVDFLLPLLIVDGIYVVLHPAALADPRALASDPALPWYGTIAYAAFIIHMTIGELLFARSLGKWLFGLKVVTLTGERPSRGQILLRNALRVIDLATLFAALIAVPLSALRQRIGDLPAHTTVVLNTQPAPDSSPDTSRSSSQDDHTPTPR